ncbi:hypothetical protein OpiT1DRAFT_04020 [Opitutaceae bacterium TAV1]|nr:hypothetical protein OpiT1DRAFT_04020 [Opitutaceae bacterium TAV1]
MNTHNDTPAPSIQPALKPAPSIGQFLSRADVAKRLGVHPETIRRWQRQGRLRAYAFSKTAVRYLEEDVQRILREALLPVPSA